MTTTQQRVFEARPYGVLNQEDLVDDSTGIIPMIGLHTPLNLKDRFARRLSKMLGAEVHVLENSSQNTVDMYLSRGKNCPQPNLSLDEELRKFVGAMGDALASIAKHPHGPQLVIARDELWDVILLFNYNKVKQTVKNLQRAFQQNQDTYDRLVSRLFGLEDLDVKGSMIDRELGDRIVSLYQNVYGFSESMKDARILVQSASEMTRVLLNLQDRLKYLLEKRLFSDTLYDLICTLGFPERAHHTFIRAARASPMFMNVTFHLRPNSPGKRVSFATPMPSLAQPMVEKPASSVRQEKSKRILRYEATAATETAVTPTLAASNSFPQTSRTPHTTVASLDPLMTAVQPYLHRQDRNVALNRLQPATQRETAYLVGTVLQRNILSTQAAAWYSFGFVTAKDEEEERRLAGLYLALLREAENSEVIFQELQTALEKGNLVALFDRHEYGHFRKLFPYLETFLKTPPKERSTVWRLRQFIKDPLDDEPPAPLQRDYGFKFCCQRRDEVLRLKEIYTRMLRKLGPMKLHEACVYGRLLETAIREGVHVDPKDRRFLHNDYPSPYLGLDCDGGLELYRGPFYKKKLKL